ncbi:hypothetical protein DRN67_01555 [Candidatus Micrarchaeota archaeon]|nr:MAG: hypothetical protein DRN67_01555 [Candidatus Micrarchaeota archaeon]
MENWVLFGILAAVAFGLSTLLNKVASGPGYFGLEPKTTGLLVGVGIMLTFAAYFLLQGGVAMPQNNAATLTAMAAGTCWAIGTIMVLKAFAGGADASRLTPIFNMNTLVVVGLGILLLKELPTQPEMIRVVSGAVFVVVGGILVST